jgi:hypothetical protein
MRTLGSSALLGGWLAIVIAGCGGSVQADPAPPSTTTAIEGTCGDAAAGITFQLQYDGLLCLGSVCGEDWLSITDSSGSPVPFLPGLIQCSDCGRCEQQPDSCYLGCPLQPPTTGPETIVWNGGVYPSSTCGNGTGCTTSSCAASGTYTATMCLHAATGDGGEEGCAVAQNPAPDCKSFSFQWPPDQAGETISWSS